MHRHRDGSGVDTSEEAGDKIQARRAQDQYTFARSALSLQSGRNRSGLEVKFAIGQSTVFFATGFPVRFGTEGIVAVVESNLV